MVKKVFFIWLILISIQLIKCKKSSSACQWASVPNSLLLELKKTGKILPDSILKNVKLSYILNGTKTYIKDFGIANDSNYANMGFMGTRDIGTISTGNINVFYLEYPNGWAMDSLYVHYISPSSATNCMYVQDPIKFNNQLAPIDASFHFDSPVYILNK